jgi:hypothetical protein
MLTLPGVPDPLPALLVSLQQTSSDAAWQHLRHTVCLLAPLPAIRVHARAGAGAASREGLAFGAGTVGRWFAIGDVVLTRSAYSAEHALPESFTHQDDWLLPAGTVLKSHIIFSDVETGIGVGFDLFMGNADMHMFKMYGGKVYAVHAILGAASSTGWDDK